MSKLLEPHEIPAKNTAGTPDPDAPEIKDSSISKIGILLWLAASIGATVFSYSLGIKQGMQAAKTDSPRQWLHYYSDPAPVFESSRTLPLKAVTPVKIEPPAHAPAAVQQTEGFTILLATYKTEAAARKELERLQKKGRMGFILAAGKYQQVCFEVFKDRKSAVQKLRELQKDPVFKTYPDAFVRPFKKTKP